MKKLKIKTKTSFYLVLGILMFCMLCVPALAPAYNYNGYPLVTVANGTVKGDVYVNCGDNYGLVPSSSPAIPHTFITNYTNVPNGNNIKWAELKIGVWGGTRTYRGLVNTTLSGTNDVVLGNETLDTSSIPSNIYEAGSGVWMICYDCTDELKDISAGSITAKIDTKQIDSGFDGRVYGATLIIVYEDGSSYTQYWINQGMENFHKEASGGIVDYNSNITRFNGNKNASLTTPTLTVGYFAGDYNQKDYLYFNAPNEDYSPYNLNNPSWDKATYSSYLVGEDVANNMSAGYPSSKYNFDLKSFTGNELPSLLTSDNYAILWRGHDSNNNTIWDPAYPNINPETEGYYVPYLAVLKIQ
jgi:hypothetical protein